jgi:hypothetical protein
LSGITVDMFLRQTSNDAANSLNGVERKTDRERKGRDILSIYYIRLNIRNYIVFPFQTLNEKRGSDAQTNKNVPDRNSGAAPGPQHDARLCVSVSHLMFCVSSGRILDLKTGTVKKEGQQSSMRMCMGSRRSFICRMRCVSVCVSFLHEHMVGLCLF